MMGQSAVWLPVVLVLVDMVVLVLVALMLAFSVDCGEMVVLVAALKFCMRGGMFVLVRRVCLGVVGARVLVGVNGGLTLRSDIKAGILGPGGRVCLGVVVVLGVGVVLEVDAVGLGDGLGVVCGGTVLDVPGVGCASGVGSR